MSASVAGRDRIAANAVVLLCFASGATDVLSYVTLGQIFTSAMTGAAALFFINLAGGDGAAAARAAIALASFVAGAAIAAAIQPRDPVRARADRPLCLLLGIEVVLLGIYSGLSIAAGGAPQGTLRYGL
ncbi:MAG TPA: DUF1275 family protein, partial [Acidiphilium sp.]